MPLPPATKLGVYEILSPLGAGGMGEVYRGRDTRLDREVAIKVLPGDFAADPERLMRFEREAKVLAALNHPHIAQIYGVEESQGVRALVMELVPGQSLSELLHAPGYEPEVALAIDCARQIAEALEAAHERGIVHRDLKPGNVMVTPEGVVKVLDFGLAAMPVRDASGSMQNSPTMTLAAAATQAGFVIGTAAYMAPEQAAGKSVDKRADIWAFGVVLWEMLTGRQLFAAETVSETLADVLRAPIDFNAVPPGTPKVVRDLLRRCLHRDPKLRLRDIGEARVLLSGPLEEEKQQHAPPPSTSRRPWLGVAVGLVAGAALVGAAVVSVLNRSDGNQLPVMRLDIPTETRVDYPALSPDGRQLLFLTTEQGVRKLRLRDLASQQEKSIPDSDGASFPFWSPDGKQLGFFAAQKLRILELGNSRAQDLFSAPNGRGAAWSDQGVILFAPDVTGPLYRINASGGTPVAVTKSDGANASDRSPDFLPGGEKFFYTESGNDGARRILLGDISGAPPVPIPGLEGVGNVRLVPGAGSRNGVLLYHRQGILRAQPVDDAGTLLGQATPMAEDLSVLFSGHGNFSASTQGTLAYRAGISQRVRLQWFDRHGTPIGQENTAGPYSGLALSPNGKKLLLLSRGVEEGSAFVLDLESGILSELAQGTFAAWFPDGSRIVFAGRNKHRQFVLKPAIGGAETDIGAFGTNGAVNDVSPDGKTIVYSQTGETTGDDLFFLSTTPGAKPEPFAATPAIERRAKFSPDGRWIAYEAVRSGVPQIYLQPVPPTGAVFQVSKSSGMQAHWRRDGKELFYLTAEGAMMAVTITPGQNFQMDATQELFPPRGFSSLSRAYSYHPSPDGQRFLALVTDGPPPPITILVNWPALLKPN